MTAVADHPQLALSRRAVRVVVSPDAIAAQPSLLAAINLCVTLSGLDDTEICLSLEIQPAQWSRIKHVDAHFPPNKLNDLMDLCGNDAPLLWLANSRGFGLHLLKSEAERRADEAQAEAIRLERENHLLRELLQGRR